MYRWSYFLAEELVVLRDSLDGYYSEDTNEDVQQSNEIILKLIDSIDEYLRYINISI